MSQPDEMSVPRAQVGHPGLLRHAEERAANLQNRIADAITHAAGSMWFVYIHVVWFLLWLRTEPFKDVFPYGLLTMFSASPTGAPALGMQMAYVTSTRLDALIEHTE